MPNENAVPGSFRVVIHPDKCIGAGHCVAAAPDVFSQNDDDGVVVLLKEWVAPDRRGDVEAAIRLCPTGVIEIVK